MSPSPSDLDGKPLAVLLMGVDEDDNEDWAVFFGIAKYDGRQLVVDRGKNKPPFVVRDEWVSRIKPVPEGTEEIFEGFKYYLGLPIGQLPADVDPDESAYEATGLTWPHVIRKKGRRRPRR